VETRGAFTITCVTGNGLGGKLTVYQAGESKVEKKRNSIKNIIGKGWGKKRKKESTVGVPRVGKVGSRGRMDNRDRKGGPGAILRRLGFGR